MAFTRRRLRRPTGAPAGRPAAPHFGLFLVGQVLAGGLLEGLDAVLALLEQLVDDADHAGVVELDALVHFLLLDGGGQHADGAQALGCPWRAWRPSCLR
jgi:hypothetical protein